MAVEVALMEGALMVPEIYPEELHDTQSGFAAARPVSPPWHQARMFRPPNAPNHGFRRFRRERARCEAADEVVVFSFAGLRRLRATRCGESRSYHASVEHDDDTSESVRSDGLSEAQLSAHNDMWDRNAADGHNEMSELGKWLMFMKSSRARFQAEAEMARCILCRALRPDVVPNIASFMPADGESEGEVTTVDSQVVLERTRAESPDSRPSFDEERSTFERNTFDEDRPTFGERPAFPRDARDFSDDFPLIGLADLLTETARRQPEVRW